MKAQGFQAGQPAQQGRQLAFQRLQGRLGIQRLQALPGEVLAIQPERRARQAGFQLDQQFGVAALAQGFLEGIQAIAGQTAQGGDLLGVTGRQGVDRQPEQAARQAQGTGIGGVLAQPPVAQRTGLLLQGAQVFLRILFILRPGTGTGCRGHGRRDGR